jgi:hypothetical protein
MSIISENSIISKNPQNDENYFEGIILTSDILFRDSDSKNYFFGRNSNSIDIKNNFNSNFSLSIKEDVNKYSQLSNNFNIFYNNDEKNYNKNFLGKKTQKNVFLKENIKIDYM